MEEIFKGLGEVLAKTREKESKYTMKDLFRDINDNLNQIIWEILDLYLLYTPAFKGKVNPNDDIDLIAREIDKGYSKRRIEEYENEKGVECNDHLNYQIHTEMNDKISIQLTTIFIKEYLRLSSEYKEKYVFESGDPFEKSLYSAYNKLHRRLINDPEAWL